MNIRGSYNILSLSRDAGKFQAGNVYTAGKKKSEPLWRPNPVPLNIKKAIFLNDTERFCAHTVRCNIDLNKFALAVEAVQLHLQSAPLTQEKIG